MHEQGKRLLNLMFRPGERVCVSHNKYGYHSIPLSEVLEKDKVTLVPTEDSCAKRNLEWIPENYDYPKTDQLLMVALNPIKTWREDQNCTAFRNFLVELDHGPLAQQLDYAKRIGLPYSACIFSGNKSLHFLISLDTDLPSENVWRLFSEWILNIANAADPDTKNPSRSIRLPGAEREPGKWQKMVEFKGSTKLMDLRNWLAERPDAKPKIAEKREISGDMDFSRVKPWVSLRLKEGLDPTQGRNKQWFAIACEFALAGYDEDDTLDKLSVFFTPDRSFKEREWKTTVKSAFKYIYSGKNK